MDQLAAWLDYSTVSSGTFASRLASARYFGLIGPARNGRVSITDRARAILTPIMPDDAVNARVDAFLAVPLFKQVFDEYRGRTIPPDVGLVNLFQQRFGVVPTRVQQAVRVFKDSARQAGFFASASDRLIRPSTATTAHPPATSSQIIDVKPEIIRETLPVRRAGGGGSGGSDDGYGVNPAVLGLLRKLPQPGDRWTNADQEAFLTAFTAVVKFVYPPQDGGKGEGQ